MLVILSPTKIQNFEPQQVTLLHTQPEFIDEARYLVALMRELAPSELSELLEINSNLTQLNIDRYVKWHAPFTTVNAKQAVLTFDGEAFRGLNPKTFTEDDFSYAQDHLRILSGLYGVLRPLDLIQPYRLEVSSKLRNEQGNDLYAFWQEKVTRSLINALTTSGGEQTVINLTSSEYFKTLRFRENNIRWIDFDFLEYQGDRTKQIVIYTKKARGMMTRFILKNRITDPEDLKGFSDAGYWFEPYMSGENKFVFVR